MMDGAPINLNQFGMLLKVGQLISSLEIISNRYPLPSPPIRRTEVNYESFAFI